MNAVVSGISTVRVPKAGEMVAAHLRRQIVLGELKEGDQLPSESVLMEQFGVSRPTLREAFRILEAEGAITVRRGVRGGARVQVPDVKVAARQAGLVLQYRGALLSDVYEVRAIIDNIETERTTGRTNWGERQTVTWTRKWQRASASRSRRSSWPTRMGLHSLAAQRATVPAHAIGLGKRRHAVSQYPAVLAAVAAAGRDGADGYRH